MKGLIYLFKTTAKNKIKKAIKKPGTYLWVIFSIAYLFFVLRSLRVMISSIQLGNPKGFTLIVSFGIFSLLPTNIITYAKRKGLIFKQSDVHFMFPSPVNPKLVLINAKARQIILAMIFNIVICVMGVLYFQVSIFNMVIYFILAFVVENILETSIMLLLYGNERFSEKQTKIFCKSLYLIIAALFCFGVYLFINYKTSWNVIAVFLTHPVIQCVPIIGWNIAFLRLLILGPTTVNVICTILYIVSTVILFSLAYKMKCTGEYYEEAIKFADNYADVIAKKKRGQIALPYKQKLGKATVEYKGKYAKAIFYRQLLEYKKNRFFIFGMASVLCLVVGIAIAVFGYYSNDGIGEMSAFIVPGVSAYITFIFSGHATKWSKEISNPYTFLIPDSTARKLWYATLIEHIRAIVDGALITIPASITLHLNIIQIVLSILIYVCLQANKLYLNVITDAIIHKYLGTIGKQLFRLFSQGTIITLCAVSAVAIGMVFGSEIGFVIMIMIATALTLLLALIASKTFENMESIE